VWDHLPGTSTDTEVDEVFVVLAGPLASTLLNPRWRPSR